MPILEQLSGWGGMKEAIKSINPPTLEPPKQLKERVLLSAKIAEAGNELAVDISPETAASVAKGISQIYIAAGVIHEYFPNREIPFWEETLSTFKEINLPREGACIIFTNGNGGRCTGGPEDTTLQIQLGVFKGTGRQGSRFFTCLLGIVALESGQIQFPEKLEEKKIDQVFSPEARVFSTFEALASLQNL